MRSPSCASSNRSSQAVSSRERAQSAGNPAAANSSSEAFSGTMPSSGRVADLPAGGARVGAELGAELESVREIVAPPAREPRQIRVEMLLMHEGAGRRARAAIQVLVGTPDREVRAPVVQRERHIAHRMGEVEAHTRADGMAGFRERAEIEQLPGQVLDAGHQDEREPRPDARDFREQVFVPEQLLAAHAARSGPATWRDRGHAIGSARRPHSDPMETRLARSGSRGARASACRSSPSAGAGSASASSSRRLRGCWRPRASRASAQAARAGSASPPWRRDSRARRGCCHSAMNFATSAPAPRGCRPSELPQR